MRSREECPPSHLEHLRAAVAELLRGDSRERGRLLDLHSVLVGAGTQDCLAPLEDLPALQRVSQDHGVEVTHMGSCDS